MDFGSILLIAALLLVVVAYILQPLRAKRVSSISRNEIALSPLLAERERILDALAELDFDHELGKVPADIYPLQRDRLMQRGAEVLRQLDDYEMSSDDPLEAIIAARRKSQKPSGKKGLCPQCGKKVKAKDQFCVSCGAKIR